MKFWSIKAKSDTEIEVSIYGDISDVKFWEDDTTPKSIKDELDKYPNATNINIYINSGGGSVFAGVAIYNMLARHKANKTVYIDGIAASAASVIAMAGNKIVMPENALMMIHRTWTIAAGNSEELLKMCEVLDRSDANLVEIYTKKTGQSAEKIKQMMDAETWMDYKEAVALGFCDEIEEGKQVAASIKDGILNINGINVKAEAYKNMPIFKIKKEIELKIAAQAEGNPKVENNGQNPVVTGDDIKKFVEELNHAESNQ